MEEAAKRRTEQEEWLRKFHQNTETSRENHDKIIQGLETKVKTLMNEIEGRTNDGKFEDCKAIFNEDGSPLYTPFDYSSKEIEYFSANSGPSDNERQETDESEYDEALVTLDITPEIKQHHTEEALVHKTMESLKKIRINRPLLKEIRQTDNYVKHMKDLVTNKPKTEEDEEIRMNPRRIDFNNDLEDSGASISVMPLSMYKRLGLRRLEPINMVIEMTDYTKCTPKGIVENLLIKIDKFIFPVDFVILEMVEDIRMPIILGRPLLRKRVHWCEEILQEKENVHQYWASCDPYSDVCDGGGLPNNEDKRYWESINDSEREHLEWEELSLNDWMKIRYGKVCKMTRERILKDHWREKFRDEEDDIEENLEDPEECGEDKANVIMGAIHDKLNDD
ncbi:zinc knuckle CX2CX4HX4C containing protein [Tanacetum coccineum]